MKKIFVLLFVLFGFGQLYADEYLPLVREGVKWIYAYYPTSSEDGLYERFSVEFTNAEIDGVQYYECWRKFLDKNMIPTMEAELLGYARENNRKVYAILPSHDGNTHTNPGLAGENQDEWLIYDFNEVSGFYAQMPQYIFYTTSGPIYKGFECLETSTMEIGQNICTAYTIQEPTFRGTLVEGYGIIGDFHDYLLDSYYISSNVLSMCDVMTLGLYSIIENGVEVYHNAEYDSIMSSTAIEDLEVTTVQDSGTYYDLQGRRVAEPTQPGIYIRNGKKVVVR